MTKTETMMLMDIAGRADAAVWAPFRGATNDNACFAGTVARRGLAWRCRSHGERKALQGLAAGGLVAVEGQTNSAHVKITVQGVLGTWQGLFGSDANARAVLKLVRRIGRLTTTRDPYGRDIVLGDRVAKRGDMGKLSLTMVPAILAGWIETAHSVGDLWGAIVTDDGRRPEIGELPDLQIDDNAVERFERAVDAGFNAIVPGSGNRVARALPSGGW